MTNDPIDDASRAARDGRLVVFPTDTVYGLATRPDDAGAVERVFAAKGRARDLTLPVLVPVLATAREIARFDERADTIAAAFWPGPLTLVLPRTARSRSWGLGGDPRTVGVRMPSHPLARAVLAASGPLATTSANRSGEAPATTCDELRAVFGDLVEVYLCEETPLAGVASTVIDLTQGGLRVLRAGDLAPEAIARLLPGGEALLDSRPSP